MATLDFSHMPAWISMCMYLTSLGRADDIHANAACMYCFSFCSAQWGDVDDVNVVLHDVDRLCGR